MLVLQIATALVVAQMRNAPNFNACSPLSGAVWGGLRGKGLAGGIMSPCAPLG